MVDRELAPQMKMSAEHAKTMKTMFMIFWFAASFARAKPITAQRITTCRMMLIVRPSSAWNASSRN